MTREEAVEILKHCMAESRCVDYAYGNCGRCNQRIALDMAIEALLGGLKTESEEDLINSTAKSIYWNTDFSNLGARIFLGNLKSLVKYWIKEEMGND